MSVSIQHISTSLDVKSFVNAHYKVDNGLGTRASP